MEDQPNYVTDAMSMLGSGYENPAIEIEAPRTVTERRDGKLVEADRPAFVKIYTNFKGELKNIDPDALKVWLFIALSVNRYSGEAHPGLRAISEGVGLAVNTVRAAVGRLDAEYRLLQVQKEDGKSNKYYPSDYVSASKDTVSRHDTVIETVSKNNGAVSKIDETVSNQYRKSAQPEEPELNQNKQHPELDLFVKHFGKFDSKLEMEGWGDFYRAEGMKKTDEITEWASKKEIHLMNRAGLLDSMKTAAKDWRGKPARLEIKERADPTSLIRTLS